MYPAHRVTQLPFSHVNYSGMTSYLNELLLNESQNDGCLYTLTNLVIEKFSETKREQRTEIPSLSLLLSLKIFWEFFLCFQWSFRGSMPFEAVRKGYSGLRKFLEKCNYIACAENYVFEILNFRVTLRVFEFKNMWLRHYLSCIKMTVYVSA